MSSGLVKVRRNSMYFLMIIDPTEDSRKKYRKKQYRKKYIYTYYIIPGQTDKLNTKLSYSENKTY